VKSVVNIAGKGRGVITTEHIKKGSLVECSDVIVVNDSKLLGNELDNYFFEFGNVWCLSLGLGSLFNHSRYPTLWLRTMIDMDQIRFYASYNIEPGDELTIDYGYEPEGYDGT
jgi:SET domain-containing protein